MISLQHLLQPQDRPRVPTQRPRSWRRSPGGTSAPTKGLPPAQGEGLRPGGRGPGGSAAPWDPGVGAGHTPCLLPHCLSGSPTPHSGCECYILRGRVGILNGNCHLFCDCSVPPPRGAGSGTEVGFRWLGSPSPRSPPSPLLPLRVWSQSPGSQVPNPGSLPEVSALPQILLP